MGLLFVMDEWFSYRFQVTAANTGVGDRLSRVGIGSSSPVSVAFWGHACGGATLANRAGGVSTHAGGSDTTGG